MRTRITILALAVAAANQAWAGEEDRLPTMTVEGTRQPGLDQLHTPIDHLQRGMPADAADFLRGVTGVSGSRMGGHGIDPVVRGQSQTRVNILLDGAYVHGGCPNRMDPPTAYSPVETYDSVTVIKGSQTVVYGGGGSGGTVLFERRTPRFSAGEGLRGKIGAGFQSNSDTRNLNLDLSAGGASGFVRGIAEYADAGNYEDGDGKSVRSAYRSRAGNLIFGYTPDDATRVELTLEATREDDVLFAGAGMDSPESENKALRLKFERNGALGPFAAVKVEAYRADVEHLMDNYSLRPLTTLARMRVPSTSDTAGGRIVGDIEADSGLVWTLGIDHQGNERSATRYWDSPPGGALPGVTEIQAFLWPDVELHQTGVFGELTVPVGAADSFKAGLRYDRVEASIDQAKANTVAPVPALGWSRSANALYQRYYGVTGADQDENNLGGFVRYEHAIGAGAGTLFGSLSRSVRTADATERYLAANAMPPAPGAVNQTWVGNPQLEPEKHHQAEIGLSWNGTGWDGTGSVYYNRVSDYILRDVAAAQSGILLADGASIYRNVSARLWGLELEGSIQWSAGLRSSAGVSLVRARNTTDSRHIAQTPPAQGHVSLDYERERWSLGGRLRFAATQTRIDNNLVGIVEVGRTSGYGVLDLYGDAAVGKQVELKFGVDNVFDNTYAYHENRGNSFDPTAVQVNEPGRSAWLRAVVTF